MKTTYIILFAAIMVIVIYAMYASQQQKINELSLEVEKNKILSQQQPQQNKSGFLSILPVLLGLT